MSRIIVTYKLYYGCIDLNITQTKNSPYIKYHNDKVFNRHHLYRYMGNELNLEDEFYAVL